MKLSNKMLIPCVAFIFVLLCAAAFLGSKKGSTVVVRRGSEVVETIDLSKVTEPYTIDLGTNKIHVDRSGVRMESASCPDKLCVKQGKLNEGAGAIVCLPNRIMIEFAGQSDDVDAVSGAR